MENEVAAFDWNSILDLVVPAASAVIVGLVAYGVSQIKRLVAATENKWDDAALKAVLDGIQKAKDDAEKPAA